MSELMSARFSAEKKQLVFNLEHEAWVSFVSGKTKGELFLPLTDAWRAKIFVHGWKMKAEVLTFEVHVIDKKTNAFMKVRPLSTTVRMTAIRPFERADKHIVLFCKMN